MSQGKAPAPDKPFVVMAKPVGALCNMKCTYCYYSKTEKGQSYGQDFGRAPGVARMTGSLLEQYIEQYMAFSPGPMVNFVWHGGEPSLAGLDFYRLAVDLQKHYLPDGCACWNNLQTNGTLLDDEWCAFLAEERFDVGVSIDGTQWLHDKYRVDKSSVDHEGSGSYERVAETIRRLQSHGLQPDLLCTVTSDTAKRPLDAYRALRDFKTGWIQFIPIVRRDHSNPASSDGVTPDSVNGRLYGEFLCAVFDEWLLHDLGSLDVQFFAETMRCWQGGDSGLCWMSPVCGDALVVEQDGGVYSCDHYVFPEYRLGDIGSSALGDLVNSPAQRRFGENKRLSLPAQCRSCPWLNVCNGGCPKDRFLPSEDGEPGLNFLCEGLAQFFSYARPAANLVSSLAGRGLRSEEIMANLRARLRALWKGIGRNDPCPCGSGKKAKHCCWPKRPSSE